MKYFTLTYHLDPDYMHKREPVRLHHLAHLNPYFERGEVVMGGAHDDINKGALIIFKVADRKVVKDFAEKDPYVIEGVVQGYEINQWNVAISQV